METITQTYNERKYYLVIDRNNKEINDAVGKAFGSSPNDDTLLEEMLDALKPFTNSPENFIKRLYSDFVKPIKKDDNTILYLIKEIDGKKVVGKEEHYIHIK